MGAFAGWLIILEIPALFSDTDNQDHVFHMTQLRIAFFDCRLELIDLSLIIFFHQGNGGQ